MTTILRLPRLLLESLWRPQSEPKSYVWHWLVNTVAASHALPARVRVLMYRLAGIDVSFRARVSPDVIIRGPKLSIGATSSVNYRCVFDNRGAVTIGKNVGIGIGVHFVTSTHEFDRAEARAGVGRLEPITVGDGAWIGTGATILAGVDVGAGAVVAAGALVRQNIPANTLWGGVPARQIRGLAAD